MLEDARPRLSMSFAPGNDMRPDHRSEAHVIVQSSKRDKFPHIFLIRAPLFQVRDVCQPFLFGRNIRELFELRASGCFSYKEPSPFFISLSNMIMYFSNSPNSSDGVVPYRSSHLKGALSEKIVPYWHCYVHRSPEGAAEVQRILLNL